MFVSKEEAVGLLLVLTTVALLYIFYPVLSVTESLEKEEQIVWINKTSADDNDIALSIIIPAYNEEVRLPIMLDAALSYMQDQRASVLKLVQAVINAKATRLEWIIVSDGSTDGTKDVARKYGSSNDIDVWTLVALKQNSGKGAAVKHGMLHATGHLCLMVDADGATDFGKGLFLVLNKMEATKSPIVFGSRAHLQSQAERSLVRTILMHAFHFFVEVLCSARIQDTQCGFKLFTQAAAEQVFSTLHLRRWAFDIEIVVLAERLGLAIEEVGVPWHEVDGSKLDSSKLGLALVSIGMLRDMICVRLCYALRIWKSSPKKSKAQ